MNFSDIIRALEQASSFDLYRLSVAIQRLLDDPKRVAETMAAMTPGQAIEYFDPNQNRNVSARLIEFKRTKVLVEKCDDASRWSIPYYWINTQGVCTDIKQSKTGLGKNEVKVGDLVGFNSKDRVERYGRVIRLNQKTVTLQTEQGQWRVDYRLLFKVVAPDLDALT